jgi:hypothetical protein
LKLACAEGADAVGEVGCASGFAAAATWWLLNILDMIEPDILIEISSRRRT